MLYQLWLGTLIHIVSSEILCRFRACYNKTGSVSVMCGCIFGGWYFWTFSAWNLKNAESSLRIAFLFTFFITSKYLFWRDQYFVRNSLHLFFNSEQGHSAIEDYFEIIKKKLTMYNTFYSTSTMLTLFISINIWWNSTKSGMLTKHCCHEI